MRKEHGDLCEWEERERSFRSLCEHKAICLCGDD